MRVVVVVLPQPEALSLTRAASGITLLPATGRLLSRLAEALITWLWPVVVAVRLAVAVAAARAECLPGLPRLRLKAIPSPLGRAGQAGQAALTMTGFRAAIRFSLALLPRRGADTERKAPPTPPGGPEDQEAAQAGQTLLARAAPALSGRAMMVATSRAPRLPFRAVVVVRAPLAQILRPRRRPEPVARGRSGLPGRARSTRAVVVVRGTKLARLRPPERAGQAAVARALLQAPGLRGPQILAAAAAAVRLMARLTRAGQAGQESWS